MPKKITCKCGHEILLARSGPGEVVVCRHCQHQITVPTPTHQMPAITIDELAKYSKEASQRKAAAPPEGTEKPERSQFSPKKSQRSVTIAGMIICPQCGKHYKRGILECAECGAKLSRKKFELGNILSDGVETGFREFLYLILDVFNGLRFLVKLAIIIALVAAIILTVLFIVQNYENIPQWLAPEVAKTKSVEPVAEPVIPAAAPVAVVSAQPELKTDYKADYQPKITEEKSTRKKGGIKQEYSVDTKATQKKGMSWYRKQQQEAEAQKNKLTGTETKSSAAVPATGKLGEIQGNKDQRRKAIDDLMKTQ